MYDMALLISKFPIAITSYSLARALPTHTGTPTLVGTALEFSTEGYIPPNTEIGVRVGGLICRIGQWLL